MSTHHAAKVHSIQAATTQSATSSLGKSKTKKAAAGTQIKSSFSSILSNLHSPSSTKAAIKKT